MQKWDPEPEHWEGVVDLVYTAFMDGTLTTKFKWQTVIFLQKGDG